MSMIYHIVRSPSYFLNVAGTYLIGDPKKWGVNVSAQEFYSLPVDRVKANPDLRVRAQEHSMIIRNIEVNEFRRKTHSRMCIYAFLIAATVLTAGNLMNTGVTKTKQAIQSSGLSFNKSFGSSEKSSTRTVQELTAEAEQLQKKMMAGEITQAEFESAVKKLNEEFNTITNKENKR